MNALDPHTFVIVFASTVVVMGLAVWLRFRSESKKQR
jgi:hypothetical protein